jgi:prepilin-type N-terminal cleavage/methylation domain-containing protein
MGQIMSKIRFSKKGFGIMEVLVAIAVLGFLLLALIHMQYGNRNSLLRIRARDGANTVAQATIDSLASIGLASVPSDTTITLQRTRTWDGTPGFFRHTMSITYDISVKILDSATYQSSEVSAYDSLKHIYAKNLDVTVSWKFHSSTQSINVAGVIQ